MTSIFHRYQTLWLSGVVVMAFLLLHYSAGAGTAKWIMDSLVLGVASGMTWTWRTAAARAIRRGASSGTDKIILTVWGAWFMFLIQRSYVLLSGALQRPDWLTTSIVPGLITSLIFLAGMYGLSAPATGQEDLPRREMIHLIIGWVITGAVGGGAVVYFAIRGPIG